MNDLTRAQLVEFGPIAVHAVSSGQAVDLVARRAASGRGGYVLTPNLDHLALARNNAQLRVAYAGAFLSLADGMPLVLASRLLGLPIREKVSGSDLLQPLMARCSRDGLPVYFLGASEATCEEAIRRLRLQYPGLEVVGYDSGQFDLEAAPGAAREALRRARDAQARLIVVCLPALKALMLHRFEADYRPAMGIGVGQALAFYVGAVRRAPPWMARAGLEWFHRLLQEPRRLWRRYLVDDPQALRIFVEMAIDRARGRSLRRTCHLDTSPARTPYGPAPGP